jgi:Methyltransferase domain
MLTPEQLPSQRFEPLRYGLGAWTEHIFFAYDLMAQMQPRVLVELGTDRGESYFAFCQSAEESRLPVKCYAIDHWQGDSHAGSYDDSTYEDVLTHNSTHYAAFSTLIRSTFDEALSRFEAKSIDLLHIDGHHTEKDARHDVESWLPKLRPGGILLIHDVNVRERDFGVWKVWSELENRGRSFAFATIPGLGVWERPPAEPQSALLELLFGAPNEYETRIEGYYTGRYRGVQAKMARQWQDGSIRDAPMAKETVIQVFWASDGSYAEERSASVRIGHDSWKETSISLPGGGVISSLRIDFFSALTTIEVAEITLEADGTMIYRAATAAEFAAISLGGDCVRVSLDPFRLRITGADPQLYLPPFSPARPGARIRLRMKVRVQASEKFA